MCTSPVSNWPFDPTILEASSSGLSFQPARSGNLTPQFGWSKPELDDVLWRNKLKGTIERAMTYLMGVQGPFYDLARGRLFEMRMLVLVLERWKRN